MTHDVSITSDIDTLRARAEAGNASAQYSLGNMYVNGRGVPEDDAEAVRWYRLAADQGVAEAQYNLGGMYDYGLGVPEDYGEALRWYRLAADQGHAEAQVNLGRMYANGRGVPQDYVQAHMWYNLAASRTTGEARDSAVEFRDNLADLMTPTQIAEAQRLAHEWAAAHPREP
jgi:TPR repeat protein